MTHAPYKMDELYLINIDSFINNFKETVCNETGKSLTVLLGMIGVYSSWKIDSKVRYKTYHNLPKETDTIYGLTPKITFNHICESYGFNVEDWIVDDKVKDEVKEEEPEEDIPEEDTRTLTSLTADELGRFIDKAVYLAVKHAWEDKPADDSEVKL